MDKKEDIKTLINELNKYLKLVEIANALGVSLGAVGTWKNGKRNPDKKLLREKLIQMLEQEKSKPPKIKNNVIKPLVIELSKYLKISQIANKLGVSYFTVRSWREGTRIPVGNLAQEKLTQLIELIEKENNIKTKEETIDKPNIAIGLLSQGNRKNYTCRRAYYDYLTAKLPEFNPMAKEYNPKAREFYEIYYEDGMKLFAEKYFAEYKEFKAKYIAERRAKKEELRREYYRNWCKKNKRRI